MALIVLELPLQMYDALLRMLADRQPGGMGGTAAYPAMP